MMVLTRSFVQPHLDYCSQLRNPSTQGLINKLQGVQKYLVCKILDRNLCGLTYWEKLQQLRRYRTKKIKITNDFHLEDLSNQPSTPGLVRLAQTDSLLHQVPLMGGWA